ncbi:MAG: methyl-accepting chemotaxis protein [Myxococcota bacterium]
MTNQIQAADVPMEPLAPVTPYAAANRSIVEYRERVLSSIQDAQEVSESAVLEVGRNVNAIVQETRDYITCLNASLGSLSGDSTESNITAAIARQSDAVATFMNDMGQHLRAQEDKAQKAVHQSVKIVEAANTIKNMAYTAKILSLNAHIEAARLGQHGRAFQVIVKEMLKFSEMVEETNLKVSGLAEDLQELLPQIAHQTRSIRRGSEAFSEELEMLNASVEQGTRDLQNMVVETMTDGDRRLQQVLQLSMDVLSRLQFQDPMIQEIQRIDGLLYELHCQLGEDLEADFEPSEPTFMIRLGDAIDVEEEGEEMLDQGEFLMF